MDIRTDSGNRLLSCHYMLACIQVGISTFGTYVLSSSSNVLTADKAFVSLALFNLLRGPLVAFPNVISSVVEVSQTSLL